MRFFTSDHHFYHANVMKYCKRPWASKEEIETGNIKPESVEAMNEAMVSAWNTVVGVDDEVWYLGDFSLARRAVEVFLPRLNGKKHLVAGNHDHCHPHHYRNEKRGQEMRGFYLKCGFASVALSNRLVIDGIPVNLSHLPYTGDHSENDRFTKHRLQDTGDWLLCGHVHEKWKVCNRMINVGVDVWNFYPVPETEIIKILRAA